MRLALAALVLLTLACPAFAADAPAPTTAPAEVKPAAPVSGTYKMDLAHTSVVWRVWHLGLSLYTARFTKADATLKLDAAKPENSTLTATIDPASLRTDYPFPEKEDFDQKLRGDKWFEVTKYPEIKFVSKSLTMKGDKKAAVLGDLTFRGVTKPVTMEVELTGHLAEHPFTKKQALGFTGTTTIKRSDFGMTEGVPFVGDEVQVIIQTEMQAE